MERIGQVNQHCIIEVTKQKKRHGRPPKLEKKKNFNTGALV